MKKIIISTFAALTLLAMSVGTVFAQDTTTNPITGTVQGLEIVVNETTGEKTVKVDVQGADGTMQTVYISIADAETLGLVTTDPATNEAVVTDVKGSEIEIDPSIVINPDEDDGSDDGKKHPIGALLETVFGESTGVDYATIMEYHDGGAGFGTIAQALWMAEQLGGDANTFAMILDAKQSGDYSGVTLPDGSTPTNWGQFKKALMDGGNQSVGHAKQQEKGKEDKEKGNPHTSDPAGENSNGNNGNGNNGGGNGNNENGNGNGNGGNKNENGNNGNGKGNGKP